MIMVVKVYKSLGGRSSTNQWSNTYEIETANAVGSPELDVEADKIVAFEKLFHTTQVHFMRVVVSTFAKEGDGHPEAVRVRELAGTGANPAALAGGASNDVLPAEIVLEVKRVAETGRTGRLLYRGCLTEASVLTGGNGNFVLDAAVQTALTGHMTTWNNDATNPDLILASRDAGGNELTRPVSRLMVGSVIIRKRHSRRKKKEEAKTEAGALQYLDEALGILAGVATFYMTKSPTLSLAARASAVAHATGVGAIVGQIVEMLTATTVEP